MTEFTNAVTVCSGLGSILALVLLLARPVRERLFGMHAIREGQKCMLRADMLAAYYKHRENIVRLVKGQERKTYLTKKKKGD